MPSLDHPPRSAADLHRLTQVSALFDYAELITQYSPGPDRDQLAQQLARETAHLSAMNMISREERHRISEILSAVIPADAAG